MTPHKPTGKTIQAGQTLTARSAGDYDCIYSVKVVERKGNWVKVEYHGDVKRKKVELDYNGDECVHAFGKYSMSPVFRAP